MRSVAPRSPILHCAVLMAALFAGPALGFQVGRILAPASALTQIVGIFAFTGVFFGGMLLWLGLGVLAVVFAALRNLVRGRLPGDPQMNPSDLLVPPGYGAFVAASLALCPTAGLLVAALSEAPVGASVLVFLVGGLAYGFGLRALAHHGYLPFPEPE